MTFQVYSLFDVHAGVDVTSRRTLTACVQLLAYTNCAVNPLIYCLLNERFKSTLSRLAVSVKLCRRGPSTDTGGHVVAAKRTRLAAVAGPPLRLGLLVTRDAAMTVDIPGTAAGGAGHGQMATCASEGHTSRTGTWPFVTKC